MRPKILVTRRIPEEGLGPLKGSCDLKVRDSRLPPSKEELISLIGDADGLICLLTDRVDGDVIAAGGRLKVISSYSAGVDHIDVDAATKAGVYVTNTPDVLTDATADHAWALLMAAARRIVEADNYIRSGRWREGWHPFLFLGAPVWGKTIGFIGFGRIGVAAARRAKGFNMRILYHSRRRIAAELEMELSAEYRPLEDLLREADFVSLHVPLTPDTRRLIDRERLRLMKPTAILINTSRGGVVDQEDLVEALRGRWIAAAGLDVFEDEPIKPEDPLLSLENVVLTPHIGSATGEARARMAAMAAENLLSILRGVEPKHLVNPEVKGIRPLKEVKLL
ncbi:MAG: 2-hydroxyacid dehydrogenase [Candidatus Bathyarchaeia archaeon]